MFSFWFKSYLWECVIILVLPSTKAAPSLEVYASCLHHKKKKKSHLFCVCNFLHRNKPESNTRLFRNDRYSLPCLPKYFALIQSKSSWKEFRAVQMTIFLLNRRNSLLFKHTNDVSSIPADDSNLNYRNKVNWNNGRCFPSKVVRDKKKSLQKKNERVIYITYILTIHLIFLFLSQRFGYCTLRPSSGCWPHYSRIPVY